VALDPGQNAAGPSISGSGAATTFRVTEERPGQPWANNAPEWITGMEKRKKQMEERICFLMGRFSWQKLKLGKFVTT